MTLTSARHRGSCHLMCGRIATVSACGYRICEECLEIVREIAADAGVTVDEQLLTGGLQRLNRRALTKAERKLEDKQERREIEAARRSA